MKTNKADKPKESSRVDKPREKFVRGQFTTKLNNGLAKSRTDEDYSWDDEDFEEFQKIRHKR